MTEDQVRNMRDPLGCHSENAPRRRVPHWAIGAGGKKCRWWQTGGSGMPQAVSCTGCEYGPGRG